MNKSGIRKMQGFGKRNILFSTQPFHAIGVQVAPTGLTADATGKKVILAGSPLGGATDPKVNRQAKLQLNGTTIYGVTQHDIVFENGDTVANANMIDFGWIDTAKMDPVAKALITDPVKTALNGKVTFVEGK